MLEQFLTERVEVPENVQALRQEVRDFVARELASGGFTPRCDPWLGGFSPEFSRKVGAGGWIGMTWPRQYGGHERSALERFVVTEEFLAAGAPVAAHWIADRQSGPLLLRFGNEKQRQHILPRITRGECYFGIGMSEPDAGSDLAAIRTSARKTDGGWILNGTKVWTSHAHHCHYLIVLCRTSPPEQARHAGMSQLLVDMASAGVSVRPISLLSGEHHFNEVHFDNVAVPDDMVIGQIGDGWQQVNAELAYERSGPERFLSTFPLLVELVRLLGRAPETREAEAVGRLVARLWTLRQMSWGVAGMLAQNKSPDLAAPLIKDLGTQFERQVAETARLLIAAEATPTAAPDFHRLLTQAVLHAPGFTLRGGTTEILRGIVARGLGAR